MKEVFIITNPELGWDCICGVFSSYENVLNYFREISCDLKGRRIEEWAVENNYIIHKKIIQ